MVISGTNWNTSALTAPTGSTQAGTATVGSYTTKFSSTGVAWAGGTIYEYIIYGIVTGSGSLTVRVTATAAGTYMQVACDEYAGVDSSPLDVDGGETTGGITTPGTDVATDSITTLSANDLIVAVIGLDGGVTGMAAGTNYTLLASDGTGSISAFMSEFRILAEAAGSKTISWTWTIGDLNWSQINVAFKPAAAAGTRQRCIGCGTDKKVIGDR